MISTFFTKKIKSAKSAKNFLHDKYRLTSPYFTLETIIALCHQTVEILEENVIFGKFCEKKRKKNFDLE